MSVVVVASVSAASAAPETMDLAKYVDLKIGSEGPQMILGATYPFGMMQLSPDTASSPTGDEKEGYRYNHNYIRAFSLTHFNGAGGSKPLDVPIMFTVGPLDKTPVGNRTAYASRFSHDKETAIAGWYSAFLDDPQIQVDLSATQRTSFARLTYPKTKEAQIVINQSGRTFERPGTDGQINFDSANNRVTGWAFTEQMNDRAFKYRIHFVLQFDRPFVGHGTWKGGIKTAGAVEVTGNDSAGYVTFDTTENPVVNVKLGISFVSIENALANINAESKTWKIEELRAKASETWNNLLNRIQVKAGGTNDERKLFYTGLYRAFLHPNVFNDVNGQYIGFDNKLHEVEKGRTIYANYSLWDTYRTQAALLGLLTPKEASDMVQSLLLASLQSKNGGLPSWAHNQDDSDIMCGYSADPFIAYVYSFGGRNFDLQKMKDKMVSTAMTSMKVNDTGGWSGLKQYIELGYCVHGVDDAWGEMSSQLEYSIDDFSIAQICEAAGDKENARYFLNRSQNWKNLYNSDNQDGGYIQSRKMDGTWVEPFNRLSTEGFDEGNTVQYTWLVPHNFAGLVQKMGGKEAAAERLDKFTEKILVDGWNIKEPYFWGGNQPCMQVPFIYNWLGQPWKTQRTARAAMEAAFQANPKGLHGDDDLGSMYAWLVWTTLGLYPEIPGVGGFTFNGPLFEEVVLNVPNQKPVTIKAANASSKNLYIQSSKIGGKPSSKLWISLGDLFREGSVEFVMGDAPNKEWGIAPSDEPPSFDAIGANAAADKKVVAGSNKAGNEGSLALDGSADSVWISTPDGEKTLTVDLGRPYKVGSYVVKHAGAAGLDAAMNTKDFKLEVSRDGKTWVEMDKVSGNKANITDRTLVPKLGRWARLTVLAGDQEGDGPAQIGEFEIYGRESANLAQGVKATASGYVDKEPPEFAVDGGTGDNSKWCDNAQGEKWLMLDFVKPQKVGRWVVKHAGAAGENQESNTSDFALEKSSDGSNWEEVDVVTNNAEDVTDRKVAPFSSRFVRLFITNPTQTQDSAARIYEFELYER